MSVKNINARSKYSGSSILIFLFGLSGCGGGHDNSQPQPPVSQQPDQTAAQTFTLEKSTYSSGEKIKLDGLPSRADSATLAFADGQTFNLPVLPDGNLLTPVATQALLGKPGKLSIKTGSGTFESNSFELQPLKITTSKPGIATLIYLEASLANINSAIDELTTLSNDAQNPEAMELSGLRDNVSTLRDAVIQVQSGNAVEISAPGATQKYVIDSQQLEIFDQYITALLNITAAQPAPVATDQGRPVLLANISGTRLLASTSAINSLDCSGLAQQDDRAWCANMRTQIANDYIINYAGMVGTVGGATAAALAALAAIGVAGTAFPAAIIGAVALGAVVVANGVAGTVQGASAYGTGTSKGTDVRQNIKNLTDAARDFTLGQIVKLFPNGGSELITEVYGTLTSLAIDKYGDRVDALVKNATNVITNCTAQASSGGQGSFARRYDFGAGKNLVLQYNAYNIPDQFSVFDATGEIAGTGGLVSGSGQLSLTSTGQFVTVKVTAPNTGTAWDYSISCAN
jgi:hypothetical protein